MVAGGGALLAVIGWLVFSGGGKENRPAAESGVQVSGSPQATRRDEFKVDGESDVRSERRAGGSTGGVGLRGYAAVVDGPETLDLLRHVNAEEDELDGDWSHGPDGALVGEGAKKGGNLAMPVVLEAEGEVLRDYELAMTLRREGAFESFRVILPLPEGEVAVVLDRAMRNGAIVTALAKVEGIDAGAPGNPTRVEGRQLSPEKDTKVKFVVRAPKGGEVVIRVLKGGRPIIEWSGPASALAYKDNLRAVADAVAARRPVLFVGKGGAVAVSKAELKIVRGGVTVLRPAFSSIAAGDAKGAEKPAAR
jgi:hypothetical protein